MSQFGSQPRLQSMEAGTSPHLPLGHGHGVEQGFSRPLPTDHDEGDPVMSWFAGSQWRGRGWLAFTNSTGTSDGKTPPLVLMALKP